MTEALELDATPWRRFVGANIKGTPAMSADKVGDDVEVLRGIASIVVTQETRWAWYWKRIGKVLGILVGQRRRPRGHTAAPARWRTSPSIPVAIARPLRAAASVMWKGRHWRKAAVRSRLLHEGEAGISEDRHLRAVLLVDWDTVLPLWAGTCHFVVGGDRASDSARRRRILDHDLDQLDDFLGDLRATGHPIAFQLDANIRDGSGASYRRLLRILEHHGARIVGGHGVEWVFVIDGDDVAIEVRDPKGFVIKPRHRGGKLWTDHEARGMVFRLVRRR